MQKGQGGVESDPEIVNDTQNIAETESNEAKKIENTNFNIQTSKAERKLKQIKLTSK